MQQLARLSCAHTARAVCGSLLPQALSPVSEGMGPSSGLHAIGFTLRPLAYDSGRLTGVLLTVRWALAMLHENANAGQYYCGEGQCHT